VRHRRQQQAHRAQVWLRGARDHAEPRAGAGSDPASQTTESRCPAPACEQGPAAWLLVKLVPGPCPPGRSVTCSTWRRSHRAPSGARQAERANALAAEQGLAERVRFQVADALQQPFADASFDLIWSMESGEHMCAAGCPAF